MVLAGHGRPVVGTGPPTQVSERRLSELLMSELKAISARAVELGVQSDAGDFDVGWTTDDPLQ